MKQPETFTPQGKELRDLSIRELSELATQEAWHAASPDSESPYIFAGKAASAAETLTRPAIMSGLWPIHERAQTEAAERTTFANTHFVVALVNAYRRGELVPSEIGEKQIVWDMLLLDGNCSDHTVQGAAKLRRILDDLIEARQMSETVLIDADYYNQMADGLDLLPTQSTENAALVNCAARLIRSLASRNAAPQDRPGRTGVTANNVNAEVSDPAVAAFSPDKQETPRTDTVIANLQRSEKQYNYWWHPLSELARQLERESKRFEEAWTAAYEQAMRNGERAAKAEAALSARGDKIPREPTEEMCLAGVLAMNKNTQAEGYINGIGIVPQIWKAMYDTFTKGS